MSARILAVDDEPRVLDGLELHLGMEHELLTATSGADGLGILEEEGPFDVVISDMRMPGMDGAAFLAEVRRRAPDTMRVLLTGQADLASAQRAINEGSIFRFLNKPCPPEELLRVVSEATELRRLRLAERELLEKTLHGCVEVLTEVLGVAVPIAFRRSHRIHAIAKRLAPGLGVAHDDRWQLEVAALLTGLGSIAVPNELLERAAAGGTITDDERAMLDQIPAVGRRLLSKVARLEGAAELVGAARPTLDAESEIDPQLRALQIAMWVEDATARGMSWERAVARVSRHCGAEIATHLGDEPTAATSEVRAVKARDLAPGMLLCQDVLTKDGRCVVRAGTDITRPLALRLRNFADNIGLEEPIRVRFSE